MKRILVLLLAIFICACLAACDEKDPSADAALYDKYEEILNFLEEEKYEEAYEALNKLAGGAPGKGDALYAKYKTLIDLVDQQNYQEAHNQLESLAGGPISTGDKLYSKYQELLSYLEGGKYAEAYQILLNLAGGSIPGDSNQVYNRIIEYLDNNQYTSAIQAVVDLANSRAPKPEPNDMRAMLPGKWYAFTFSTDNDPIPYTAEFKEDGSCVINGEKRTWITTDTGDDYMHTEIYNNGVQTHYATIYISESKVLSVRITSADSEADDYINKYFYAHPLVPYLVRGWNMLDTTNTFDNGINIDTDEVSIDIGGKTKKFKYAVESYDKADELVLKLYQTDATKIEFTATIYEKDNRYVVDLKDVANNTTYLYYSSYTGGYDKSWPEYLYRWAMGQINYAIDRGDFDYLIGDPETGASLNTRNDVRAAVYRSLEKCGNYKDAKTLLANFSVYKKMLTRVNRTYVTNLGATSTNTWGENTYNSDGRLYYSYDSHVYDLYFGSYGNSSGYYFEYDANGRISRLTYGTGNNISAIYTPEYDANGRMISLKTVNNSVLQGWISARYTYDADGRMTLAEYFTSSKPDTVDRYITFTYDAQGRLTQQAFCRDYTIYTERETLDYTYDASGNLATETYTEYDYDYSWNSETREGKYTEVVVRTILQTYTCDAEGDIVSAVITDSRNTQYASVTDKYIYTDLYFYALPESAN